MWSLRNKATAHTAGREYTEIAETKLKESYRKAKEFLKGGFVRHNCAYRKPYLTFRGSFRPNVTMLPALSSWATRPQKIERDVVDSVAIRTR